jgi:hypothetical protein
VGVVRPFHNVAFKVQQQPAQRRSAGRVQGRGNGGGGADRRWIGFCIWICQIRYRVSKLADKGGKIHFSVLSNLGLPQRSNRSRLVVFSVDSFFLWRPATENNKT